MLIFTKDDLMQCQTDALINTVNLVGVMGKGIALQFKNAFPYNFNVYTTACKKHQLHIGQLLIVNDHNLLIGEKIIINFPTKTHWRLLSEYAYIEKGLKSLRNYILGHPSISIAMPALGCGNGGLDWAKVRIMIANQLGDLPNRIIVCEPF